MENDALERIVKVEQKVGVHEKRLNVIDTKVQTLHADLGKLIALTSNIRWWLTGVGTLYVVEQIGLMPFIKSFLGV